MIKRNQSYFNWLNRLLDVGIIYISYALAVWFWIFLLGNDTSNIAVVFMWENPMPLLIVAFGFMAIFQYGGMYDSFRFRTLLSELFQLLKLFLPCVAAVVGAVFLFKLSNFSRGVMVVAGILAYALLCAKRAGLRAVLRMARAAGYNQKHVIIVGSGKLARKYVNSIHENPQFGFHLTGYIGRDVGETLGRYLGDYEHLSALLDAYYPDEVIIALEQDEIDRTGNVISCCEEQGIRANIIPIYNDYLPVNVEVDAIDDVRLINLRTNSQDITFNRVIKRGFDLGFALVAIALTLPLMLVIAVGVKLSSPGPILFKQQRVGRNRKRFMMFKFRSMVVSDVSDTTWSRNRDSRVTPFGAFIRKFSLDELPQFFNVLRGEMSVVGPRPELPYFVEQYRHEVPLYMVKHQVKPGITGWAQVNGYRGDTSIEKRIEHDVWYIENWSLFLDIKIVMMTVFGGLVNKEKNMSRKKEEQHV